MAKARRAYFCQNCGAEHSQWMGQCARCGEWNTLVEELVQKEGKGSSRRGLPSGESPKKTAVKVGDAQLRAAPRQSMRDPEFDRVLGGGLVAGAVILLGGEPGIGKSTLMLQTALLTKRKCLYVSGEESEEQVQMRAQRLGCEAAETYLLTSTRTQEILAQAEALQPDFLVIDSIQTLHSELLDSAPGSVSQIRQCAAELIELAKARALAIFLIGHITKEGTLAGPKILEHMVDAVLQFEGDRQHAYRLLRAQKNRFGSTHEIGIYEMQGEGLRAVNNPSEVLLSDRDRDLSGNAIAATLEGIRPMLVEVQALCSSAVYGTPQRSTTGYDVRRLNMLLAVLEKRSGFKLAQKDVFLNLTGGLRVTDPALDLAVIAAILSSNEDIPLSPGVCFAAEVGLSGEIRPVPRLEQRLSEADKLGLETIFISRHSKLSRGFKTGLKVVQCGKTEEVFQHLFG